MNALWVWRNRNCSVSFWWELLYWMNNLCNCCLLVCRAWILPDRCAWRAVSVCSDCTNTSCSASPLKLSIFSNCHPSILCLSHSRLSAGRMSGPCWIRPFALHSAFVWTRDCSPLPSLLAFSLHRHNPVPALTKDANICSCHKAALIFPGYLSLFCFTETIGGIWSWFREGFVPSHFCDSGIWEERKRKHVILEEDILEDMSDLSLASKELGCPGRAKHCPSSHDSLFLVPRDRSMVLQALGTKSCSTEGSDEARAPPASGKQQSSRGLFLWCHPGLLGNRDMAEENIALNWKGHALSSYYSISWTGLFCQKVAVAR